MKIYSVLVLISACAFESHPLPKVESFNPLGVYVGLFSEAAVYEENVEAIILRGDSQDEIRFRRVDALCESTFVLVASSPEEMVYEATHHICIVVDDSPVQPDVNFIESLSGSIIITPTTIGVVNSVSYDDEPEVEITFSGDKL
jgi:hypothetical protein